MLKIANPQEPHTPAMKIIEIEKKAPMGACAESKASI
jgi:hypothetical protein